MYMKKTFENEGGNIVVRPSPQPLGCGIVEMMHMWDKNKSGCVIAAWYQDKDVPEFRSIGDRFATTLYSFDIMEAVKYGDKLAKIIAQADAE